MKTRKPPVIDKDLEGKAFRIFLRLLDPDGWNLDHDAVARRAIEHAQEFDRAWASHCIPEPIGLHSMPPDEVMEYYPGPGYDSQI
jgi:hypothetical protein